ncbi:PQQ-dependent sugar dehydrogenase [Curvibacter sp. APW13]|uniref:PQQ-dependent sugar dehydrogenase n=1 Tax=Curvibacter sp. APW13 TaxID=3077236 RepID=UPI0028DF0CB0|nr:PQQ-dependent sugar dehydrogenase [Curvibacter sp. APW13]MDT8991795.1 PQQ-dependent sugar dehydrogenase [Curvibacter sp. APW13]
MHRRPLTQALWSLALLGAAAHAEVSVQTIAKGLEHPWAVAFLPDGAFLVTERPGRMRVVQPDGRIGPPLQGVPEVASAGQGGLLDLVLDKGFADNRRLYFCYAQPSADGRTNSTALAVATLSADASRLDSVRTIFVQQPKVKSTLHFGCRIAQSPPTAAMPVSVLYLTLGERFHHRDDAQKLDNHHGKVVRVAADGSIPPGNPFATTPGALPEIWSYGHRNPQGAVLAPDGTLWIHEHGPMGGDEINLPRPGANYGWPLVSYGRNYNFTAVGNGKTQQEGTEQPVHQWTPSIAPSGMAFVTSKRYGDDWVGNLLVGSLKFTHLARLELAAPFTGPVVKESRLLTDLGERVRDVRQGPDGYIYLLTDHPQGSLLRLVPSP